MTVYVDDLKMGPRGRQWCRLLGTSVKELEDFAVTMGVPVIHCVIPIMGPRYFALTEVERAKAIRKGAVER
jgi:hypothetical protein